jgi:hypothetical protein
MDKKHSGRKHGRVQLGPSYAGIVLFIESARGGGYRIWELDTIEDNITHDLHVTEQEAYNLIDYLKEELGIE